MAGWRYTHGWVALHAWLGGVTRMAGWRYTHGWVALHAWLGGLAVTFPRMARARWSQSGPPSPSTFVTCLSPSPHPSRSPSPLTFPSSNPSPSPSPLPFHFPIPLPFTACPTSHANVPSSPHSPHPPIPHSLHPSSPHSHLPLPSPPALFRHSEPAVALATCAWQVTLLDGGVFGPSLPHLLALHIAGRPLLTGLDLETSSRPLLSLFLNPCAHAAAACILCMSVGFLVPADVADRVGVATCWWWTCLLAWGMCFRSAQLDAAGLTVSRLPISSSLAFPLPWLAGLPLPVPPKDPLALPLPVPPRIPLFCHSIPSLALPCSPLAA
ncbi:unnamed protein product [Closterium sp. NIES-65]|nr:unnamed protein product [Closterium sp. NIES-65]